MSFDSPLLEQPPWSALTTAHAAFALGNGLARRYRPDFAPMAGVREVSEACLQGLAALMAPGDVVSVFGAKPVQAGGDLAVVALKTVEQMVYRHRTAPSDAAAAAAAAPVLLSAADVPAMLELAELAQPGPFAPRTNELGCYLGIRDGGRLVAMAGERMRLDGFTEISAVCTHPDHRGRGLAAVLVRALMQSILQRGEVPFLHVFSDNAAAAALYAKLGFAHRRSLSVTVLRRK